MRKLAGENTIQTVKLPHTNVSTPEYSHANVRQPKNFRPLLESNLQGIGSHITESAL